MASDDPTNLLRLDDQISIKMPREQAAALVLAASVGAPFLVASLADLANRASRIIQMSGAPAGVLSEVLGQHSVKGEKT